MKEEVFDGFIRKRKKVKRFKKRYIMYGILILVLIGFGFEQIREGMDRDKFQPPGQMIEVNGHKMHIYGEGQAHGKPTVLFTSGWKTPSPYVDYSPLQKAVAEYTRAVVYERPGYGWSEIAKGERDVDTMTRELHELLQKAAEKGPYILVGHSFGANEVLRFAQLYKDEVVGVILLDGSNPDYTVTQKRPSRYFLKYGTVKSTILNNTINCLNTFGITRLLLDNTDLYSSKLTGYKNNLSLVSYTMKKLDEAMLIKTLNNKNHLQELRMDAIKLVEAKNIGDIPLKVMTSSVYNEYELTRVIQQGLLKWSSNSEQIIVSDSQHYIHWFHPEMINEQIKGVIQQRNEK